MFFGMFSTPIVFILPLIFVFVIFRFASSFFRGISRRSSRSIMDDDRLPPELLRRDPRSLVRGKNSDEASIFKLALKLQGRLTVSDIVIETGLNLHEAEELVQGMVDNTHVRMEVSDRGMVTYEFPEIIQRIEGDGPGVG
jgi:hypothetical protein